MTIVETLRQTAVKKDDKRVDFDGNCLNDCDYINLTGLDKNDFEMLCSYVPSGKIRDTKVRSVKTCIGILLTKLKTGLSNKILSTIFNSSKDAIKRAVVTALKALN